MNIDSGSAEAEARDSLAVIGFAEVERRLAAAREDTARMVEADRQYLAGLQQGYIWGLAGEGEKYAEACTARAEQIHAARSPGPGKCECIIERNPARMSAVALQSGASAEIIGPLCAYCKAAHQTRRDTTVKKGTPA